MANEFLTLGALNVPIRDATASQAYNAVGGYGRRAHSGGFRAEARGLVDSWTCTTKQLSYAEIEKLRAWLLGQGFTFPFDADLYSSNGLGPDPGFSAAVTPTGGQFGGFATVASGTLLQYTVGFSAPYSFGVWKDDGGGFVHYVLTDDGTTVTQYKGGAVHTPIVSDDITLWAGLASNVFTLQGKAVDGTNAQTDFDDAFCVPFAADADDVAAWFASANPFSPLPAHYMSGKVIDDDTRLVNLSSLEGGILQFGDGATWNQNAQQLTFTLQEKTRRF